MGEILFRLFEGKKTEVRISGRANDNKVEVKRAYFWARSELFFDNWAWITKEKFIDLYAWAFEKHLLA